MTSNHLLVVLGKAIRERRENLGLSQERMAELAGIHRTYAGAVERGERNIAAINLERIARALKKQPSQIWARAEELLASERRRGRQV